MVACCCSAILRRPEGVCGGGFVLKIGILVVAYNAAETLVRVLDRIPADFRPRIERVLISDDASVDATYLVGIEYSQSNVDLPITVVRQNANLGYGGNQKVGYRWAIEHDLDIVVLLHGDGQYAPELLPNMVAPIEDGAADCVMGSRMMIAGGARRGGMPLYKYFGNKVLTRFENFVTGAQLSEWHSGYRAYSVDALRSVPFNANSNGFAFDTEVIVQMLEARKRIIEIPIPTYYGDEISHVNGMKYASDITRHVIRYRLHKMGLGSGELAFMSSQYENKLDARSSHALLAEAVDPSAHRILDLGCGAGHLARQLSASGHRVTGIDLEEQSGEVFDRFMRADLNHGLPDGLGTFDQVVAADVLEHLARPEELLRQLHDHVTPDGALLVSIPNFAHWYPRFRVALGRFDYDRRGILDQSHLRFFTRSSFERLASRAGWSACVIATTPLPLEVVDRASQGTPSSSVASGFISRLIHRIDDFCVRLWPSLFAYQYLFLLSASTPAGDE